MLDDALSEYPGVAADSASPDSWGFALRPKKR